MGDDDHYRGTFRSPAALKFIWGFEDGRKLVLETC